MIRRLITGLVLMVAFVSAEAQTLTLFALQSQSVKNTNHFSVQRCNLDDYKKREKDLQKMDLSHKSDGEIKEITKINGEKLTQDIHCLQLAKQLGIKVLPTLLVEQQILIEGVWDIQTALDAMSKSQIADYQLQEYQL